MSNPGEGLHAPQCNGSNRLYAVVGMALSTINLWVEGSIPSLLTQVAQLVEQQFMQHRFESCSRSKRDSSAAEHNTQDVENKKSIASQKMMKRKQNQAARLWNL